jgi:hypothetical protein
MKKICPSLFASLLLIFSFMLLPWRVQAAEMVSLTASPVRVGDDGSVTLNPGEKKQVQLKIRNNSDQALTVESRVIDFTVAEDGQTPIPVTEETSNRWSLASWVTLVPAVNTIEANSTAVVNALIEVPADALPGGHYALVYHTPNNEEATTMGSGISQRVGTLLYVIVSGDIKRSANIQKFDWPKFVENGPIGFSLKVDNQSDVHLNVAPEVRIYNLFGKEVGHITLDRKNVFPLATRQFDGVWDKVWGFGYYKAVAEVVYSDQGQVATAVVPMWMIPVKLLLLVAIALLLIIIFVKAIKRRKGKSGGNGQMPSENATLEADDSTDTQF